MPLADFGGAILRRIETCETQEEIAIQSFFRFDPELSPNGFTAHVRTQILTQVVAAHEFYPNSEMVSRRGGRFRPKPFSGIQHHRLAPDDNPPPRL